MLWAILGTACVLYTLWELLQLRSVRAAAAGRTSSRTGPPGGRNATAPGSGAASAPDVQFGDVEPPASPVTLDRRTRHDPYLAQLKRRASDQ